MSLMTPGVPGILPRRCARPGLSGILGAEELSAIPDSKVAGMGEEQLGPLCFQTAGSGKTCHGGIRILKIGQFQSH